MKTLFLTLILVFSSFSAFAKKSKRFSNSDKKIIMNYQKKCLRQSKTTPQLAKKVCHCQTVQMDNYMPIQDLKVLLTDPPKVTPANLSQIPAYEDGRGPLDEMEYYVRIKCEAKYLRKG